MAKKSEAVFSSEAKILGVKLKAGQADAYRATPNKIEIAFEIEMPRPGLVLARAAWQKGNSVPYALEQRLRDLKDIEKNGGKRVTTNGFGKSAKTAEEEVDVDKLKSALEQDLAKTYEQYAAKAQRQNERAAAAANHAGLFMALGGQTVRVSISPLQASMPGMLALAMPEDLGDPDEDNYDGDEDDE